MQYEACKEALELLESTPDAQGRKLQVHKVYLPPNLFLSQEEASQMVVRLKF
jgi:agmatine/peptidylarginine deiminase